MVDFLTSELVMPFVCRLNAPGVLVGTADSGKFPLADIFSSQKVNRIYEAKAGGGFNIFTPGDANSTLKELLPGRPYAVSVKEDFSFPYADVLNLAGDPKPVTPAANTLIYQALFNGATGTKITSYVPDVGRLKIYSIDNAATLNGQGKLVNTINSSWKSLYIPIGLANYRIRFVIKSAGNLYFEFRIPDSPSFGGYPYAIRQAIESNASHSMSVRVNDAWDFGINGYLSLPVGFDHVASAADLLFQVNGNTVKSSVFMNGSYTQFASVTDPRFATTYTNFQFASTQAYEIDAIEIWKI